MKPFIKTEKLTKISIFISILCISAYISFPLPFSPAPVTLQTAVLNMMALILQPREAVLGMALYILLGVIGLPVFSGGVSGIGKILGPSGGYLVGMVFAAWLISVLKGKKINMRRYLFITVCIGMPVIYIGGIISMSIYLQQNLKAMVTISILPYLPGDLLKCAAGSYFGAKINHRINKGISHE